MMKSGEVWKNGDMVELFYTPDTSAAPAAETDKAINVGYSVQLTLADGRVIELTSFGFEDIKKEAELCFEDEVGFVKYVSKASGDEMSTNTFRNTQLHLIREQQRLPLRKIQAAAALAVW